MKFYPVLWGVPNPEQERKIKTLLVISFSCFLGFSVCTYYQQNTAYLSLSILCLFLTIVCIRAYKKNQEDLHRTMLESYIRVQDTGITACAYGYLGVPEEESKRFYSYESIEQLECDTYFNILEVVFRDKKHDALYFSAGGTQRLLEIIQEIEKHTTIPVIYSGTVVVNCKGE